MACEISLLFVFTAISGKRDTAYFVGRILDTVVFKNEGKPIPLFS